MPKMSDRMLGILRMLNARRHSMSPHEIGIALRTNARSVIGQITGLRARGFVTIAARRDALSGHAYAITTLGIAEARSIARESSKPDAPAGARCAHAGDGVRCDGPLFVAENGSGSCLCEAHLHRRHSRGGTCSYRLARS